jgi:hypothetical protein
MSGTHGDLFAEIGRMVLAAHAGQAIDLEAKSQELARRYWNLGVPADTIANAIARSVGAIGMSMAIVSHGNGHNGNGNGHAPAIDPIRTGAQSAHTAEDLAEADKPESPTKAAAALFPSGLRLAVLS